MPDLAVNAPPETDQTPPSPPGTPHPAGAPGTPEPPKETGPKLFFSKGDADEPATPAAPAEPKGIDPTTLPPDLQVLYKSMQADYTRKTQEVAELRKSIEGERRAVLDEREKFLSRWEEAQRERAPRPVEEPASNPLERIRQLREEGRHEEADALLMAAAEETVAPIKAKAEVQERQATFRNIIAETRNADPIVANYFKDVAAIWDAPDPAVTIVRNALLSSPENMKYIPTILNIVARAVHAEKIEAELETRIKKERKSAVESEKARAAGIPSSLIESGGRSRDGAAPKLSIREAARLALRSSLGASDA